MSAIETGTKVTVNSQPATIVAQHPSGDYLVTYDYAPGFPVRVLTSQVSK